MIKTLLQNRQFYFILGLAIFVSVAVLGWIKLPYGFNFIDEGYHMTEGWRLAAGDHFLKDRFTGALRHYTLFNALIFTLQPDITLLGFRELQYFLAIFSLALFGCALYRATGQYWYLPTVLSIYAFTGLDPLGGISNLSYYTYPHFFVVLHLSFLLLGLYTENNTIRHILFIVSGICLWCISLSLLHAGVIIASPFILYFLARAFTFKSFSFTFSDLCYVAGPFLIGWILFIAFFNTLYFANIFYSLMKFLGTPDHSPGALAHINWDAYKHTVIMTACLLMFHVIIRKFRPFFMILSALAMSVLVYFIIQTSFFGLIAPYYRGLFSIPMWHASMLISFCLIFWIGIWKARREDVRYELPLLLMIPCTIMFATLGLFSGTGPLTFLDAAIPATVALALSIILTVRTSAPVYLTKFMVLILFFLPFHFSTALFDWEFTFYDVVPEKADVVIDKGFGKGIKTNRFYHNLYGWIQTNSDQHTEKNDFIISHVFSPMVHMIAKRRPSLDDTYLSYDLPEFYFDRAIKKMIEDHRQPKIAFIFEGCPALFKVPQGNEYKYQLFGDQFLFSPEATDPISKYIINNMEYLNEFKLPDGTIVGRCFIDRGARKKEEFRKAVSNLEDNIRREPRNPLVYFRLGCLYQKSGNYAAAIENYINSLHLDPEYVPALKHLAILYSIQGEPEKALSHLKRTIEIQPGDHEAYYNIACIYAKQERVDASLEALAQAVEKGFDDWALLESDRDLDNIRSTIDYRNLVETHGEP